MVTKEQVLEVLKTVNDPEIPVNIVDLGLIYGIQISAENDVGIDMTLTAVGCPMHATISAEIEEKVKTLPGVNNCKVTIQWDPPWTPARMSQEAKLKLGFIEPSAEQSL
ncbi:TPA: DUF59 domain-containing protein [archaeon]|uniref:DUF59 domain-containing protein n=1 Tax=Candidatus Naiadarchaeum limnaeum TaxID=2756139 RepID=A0A832UVN7_9ARCH|nr:DUF59 domain-containing protein [Candidatus Naiadarchaeales archaeon SRR2090153.bin1042]HIK00565.1 DUF59 domain-containing protein [Candidatus Naiadarchaeum limnaeum]